ncbi:MAG: hypothetical protein O7F76_14140, partial [Planctomycetota bacterium]|nr:hypothetical protein [Planctomycetota bacterium]
HVILFGNPICDTVQSVRSSNTPPHLASGSKPGRLLFGSGLQQPVPFGNLVRVAASTTFA